MREVTLRVRHHGEPESDVSARYPDVTLRSASSMTGRESERKRIVEVSGSAESIPAFLEEFAAAEAILDVEPLTPLGEERVFFTFVADEAKWDSIAERLSDLGIHYRTGTTVTGGWERWTLYLEEQQLSTVIDHLESAGNEVELVRNVALSELEARPQLEFTRFLDDLTPRQREVLATAIGLGYYDHGGDVSIERVADELGLGTTTVWEHLSRAEAKVMNGLAEHLER